ncbi:MAG TPA: cytochrome C oxidase subunit I, partial [Gammaproteobacteria bacterium]|nr:cytochrome C oxidase subunit I [Gammaproteobacteria bacterium]
MSANERYILPVPDDWRQQLAIGWLWLGVSALLASGVFSVLLVLSRTPYSEHFFPWIDFFHTALVVHVDLSVLVWFLAFSGVLWSLNSTPKFRLLGWSGLVAAIAGTIIIMLSPFTGDGNPLMSNYIPVLENTAFTVGMTGFVIGIILLLARSMTAINRVGQYISAEGALRFGLNATMVSALIALLAFAWSYLAIPDSYMGKAYYELLFWGGGHILQFTYTLLMLVGWLWLASASDVRLPISPRVVLVLFAFGLFAVFLAPLIYYSYAVTSSEHIKLFTWLMRYGGSLASLPLSLAILYGLFS